MIAQINQLIDTKLLLLFHSTDQFLLLHDFKNTPKSKLQEARILAEMMQRKGLIELFPNHQMQYQLTDFGKQICENGGWLQHFENLKSGNTQPTLETIQKKNTLVEYLKSIIASLTFHKNKS